MRLAILVDRDSPIHVKILPGSDVHKKICDIADLLEVSTTKAARMTIRNGWLGFWKQLRNIEKGVTR